MRTHIFIPCPLCGKDNSRKIYSNHEIQVVRCRECGFRYQNPRSKNLIDRNRINQKEYYQNEYLAAVAPHKKLFEEKFDEFMSGRNPGRVLDVGCATGQFLDVAKDRGWQAVGIDVSKWACNYLTERGFPDIYNCTLEEARFADNSFDVVHMNHVLEHIPAPSTFLGEVHRILKPKGLTIIEVPNEALFPFNYRIINFLLPENKPPRKHPKSHLSLFTKNTLKKILWVNNLNLISIRVEGFAAASRAATPVFNNKTLLVRCALRLCSLRLDVILGLGRYIVAAAGKF